jgi:hypothetical protein
MDNRTVAKRLPHYRRNTLPVKIFGGNTVWTNETKYAGVILCSN